MKFSEIYKENKAALIKRYSFFNKFYSKHHKENNKETLLDHSINTLEFFIKFSKERNIDCLFDRFDLTKESIDELKKQVIEIIFLHDIGKLNPYFQETCNEYNKNLNSDHSDYSYILLTIKYWDELKELNSRTIRKKLEENKKNIYHKYYLLTFCYCTALHHTNLSKTTNHSHILAKLNDIVNSKDVIIEKSVEVMPSELNQEYRKKYEDLKEVFKESCLLIRLNDEKFQKEIFFNCKLFYSLIVLSDYYATYSYQFGQTIDKIRLNKIDDDLLTEIETNFYNTRSHNSELKHIENLELIPLDKITENINDLRQNLIIQSSKLIIKSLKEEDLRKIFMLHVPTGGGKTNISLKLAIDILKEKREINRLFWVFPYVNIIEQNSSVIKSTYFADEKKADENVSQIYHDTIDLVDVNSEEDYENNIAQIIESNLNLKYMNNPINIISNVNFFNAFFKSTKQNRYKCANFTNSVVVIDEIQTLKSEYLDLFYNILKIISEKYNIYFIIMSATLPNVNEYIDEDIAIELVQNSREYFSHPVFKRNSFEINDIKRDFITYFKSIIEKHKAQSKFLAVFNTVKTSISIFKELRSIYSSEWKIFLLNSYILKQDRNKIIKYIKNSNEKIILVSTQSIEAGVDLNFDVAIRDKAILDSIEQVAGRVNREASVKKSKNSKVYIIDYENESKIYYNDERFTIIKEDFSNKALHILSNNLFDEYYAEYFKKILENQVKAKMMKYDEEIKNFNYKEIQKLNVIDDSGEGIRLIFEQLTSETIDEIKTIKLFHKCSTVGDLLNLKEGKTGFSWIPYTELISKIILKNSIELKFFDSKKKSKFIDFLRAKEYLVSELGESIIVKENFA